MQVTDLEPYIMNDSQSIKFGTLERTIKIMLRSHNSLLPFQQPCLNSYFLHQYHAKNVVYSYSTVNWLYPFCQVLWLHPSRLPTYRVHLHNLFQYSRIYFRHTLFAKAQHSRASSIQLQQKKDGIKQKEVNIKLWEHLRQIPPKNNLGW